MIASAILNSFLGNSTAKFLPKLKSWLHFELGQTKGNKGNKSERPCSLKQFVSLIVLYFKFNKVSVSRTLKDI